MLLRGLLAWFLIGNMVLALGLVRVDQSRPSAGLAAAQVAALQVMALTWPVWAILFVATDPPPAKLVRACAI